MEKPNGEHKGKFQGREIPLGEAGLRMFEYMLQSHVSSLGFPSTL